MDPSAERGARPATLRCTLESPAPLVGPAIPRSGRRAHDLGPAYDHEVPPRISAIHADITTLRVDAIVNAANSRMRGGSGVDGAIHAAGGPAVLADCVERFPDGLATGDAGWTTAGDLPARYVIHTVGPNRRAGETDRDLLVSCYRRSLEVADELGVGTLAFSLIGAGVYGWSKADSIGAALEAIEASSTAVEHVMLVGYDVPTHEQIELALAEADEAGA